MMVRNALRSISVIHQRKTCSALATFIVVVEDEDVWSSCAPCCGPANLDVASRDFHSFDRWRCHMESTAPQHLTPLWTHLLAVPLSDVCPLTNWLPAFHLHRQTPQTLRANLKEILADASASHTGLIASASSARLETVWLTRRKWSEPSLAVYAMEWGGGKSWRRGGETQGCKWLVHAVLQGKARCRYPESLNEQLATKRPPNPAVWILTHCFSVQRAKSSPASPRAAKTSVQLFSMRRNPLCVFVLSFSFSVKSSKGV